jgi:hypothetical protein
VKYFLLALLILAVLGVVSFVTAKVKMLLVFSVVVAVAFFIMKMWRTSINI